MELVEWYPRAQALSHRFPSRLCVDPQYGGQDADTVVCLHHFSAVSGAKVMEIGANESALCRILADNGYQTTGIDLRTHEWRLPHNYTRIQGDFVSIASLLVPNFDALICLSALEHFGRPMYSFWTDEPDYDSKAVAWMYFLLKPDGVLYLTVPYGMTHREEQDWRVYSRESLARLFPSSQWQQEVKLFFMSGACDCNDTDGVLTESHANKYSGVPPHVTVFLKLRKRGA